MLELLAALLLSYHSAPTNYAGLYADSAPSIVGVSPYEKPEPLLIELFYAKMRKKKIAPKTFKSGYRTGSGIVIRSDGVILTAAHIVRGTSLARIKDIDGTVYRAAVLARDEEGDLALLKIVPTYPYRFKPIKLSKQRPCGWPVYAIGNPAGFSRAVTSGIITTYDIDYDRLVSDAYANPGSSGGGLFDATNGKLLGVVVQTHESYSASIDTYNTTRFLSLYLPLAG